MPTINKRFLGQCLLVVAVVVGLIVGVHTIQASRIPDALKRQVANNLSADKPDKAVKYLRQYLEFRPTDVDAQEELAELLKKRGGTELVFLYDRILRTDPTRHAVRKEAIALNLRLNRNSDAAAHAQALVQQSPNDAGVWRQLGTAQARRREFDAARTSFESAVRVGPGDVLNHLALAEFLWLDANLPTDAKTAFDAAVTAVPKAVQGYLGRVRFRVQTTADQPLPPRTADPVLADLATAAELDPTNADVALLTGERQQRHGDLTAAHTAFRNGLQHHPGDVRLVRSLAWLEVHRGNPASAIAVLEAGVASAKDPAGLLVTLGDLLAESGDHAGTEAVIAKLAARKSLANHLQAEYLRGRQHMKRRAWSEAVATFAPLRTAAIEFPALETQVNLLLAGCYEELGEVEQQIESLRRVTARDGSNLAARVNLAQALLNSGQPAEAQKEYEAAALAPSAGLNVLTNLMHLRANRLIISGAPSGEWAALERAVNGWAGRLGTKTPEGVLLVAQFATVAGKPGAVVPLLQKAAGQFSTDVRVWAAYAEAVTDVAGVAAGLTILDDAQSRLGDGSAIRLARAELYARDPAGVRPLAPLERQTDGWAETEQTRLLYGLIDVYDRLGDTANVLRLYRKVTVRRPKDVGLWLAICERAWQLTDAATAREAAGTVAELEPTGEGVLACRLWESLATGSRVSEWPTEPKRADVCLAIARLLEKEGKGDAKGTAAALRTRAARLEPTKFEPARALLAQAAATSSEADTARLLARYATDPRWSGEPFRRLVRSVAGTLGDAKTVERLLAAVRPMIDRQPGGLGWFADTLAVGGRPTDALAVCERIVGSPAATADDWLRFALHTGRTVGGPAAVRVIETAKGKLPPVAFAALAAAFRETPAGRGYPSTLDARTVRARLALHQTRVDREAAIQLLDEYLPRAGADAAWARRTLAMVLTVRGEPADRTRAVRLLTEAPDETPDEQRATAAVLSSLYRYLDGAERADVLALAIKRLEPVTANGANPRDVYSLIQLYRAGGRTADAVRLLQQLLNQSPNDVELLLTALGVLLDANQPDTAKPFADRLLATAPSDLRVVAAVADRECRVGNVDRAIALLDGYTRTADLSAGEQVTTTAAAADVLAGLAKRPGILRTPAGRKLTTAAAAKWEPIVPIKPTVLSGLAAALATDGRVADAFAVIEKHAKSVPVSARAAAGIAVVRIAGVSSGPDVARVQDQLAAAQRGEPTSLPLLLAEAELRTATHDLDGAEKAYEAVLRRDPGNAVALNNLAWLLAPKPGSTERAFALIDAAAKETGLTAELLDTRARVRISAKQFAAAERDAAEALKQDKTPLRYFHLALAKQEQNPTDARTAFQEAVRRGLDANTVHPLDVPTFTRFAN